MIDATTLHSLSEFPQQLESFYNAIPAEHSNWAPISWEGIPSETLTAIEQICHVRDIETDGYHARFQRTLDENHPTLAGLDTYGLARERIYSKAEAVEVFADFRRARAKTIQLLSQLSPEQCRRSADFEGYGPVTIRALAHYLCSHDQQHLAGIQWLLGKLQALEL
jgi:DinB superfamily